jgi:hypothetical protein
MTMGGPADIAQAKQKLYELATQPNETWDEEVELLKVIVTLIDSGDVEAQRFIVEQVRRAGSTRTSGLMALALLGRAESGPVDLAKKLKMSPARPEVIRELESFIPTAPPGSLLSASVASVVLADRDRAIEIFAPYLDAGPNRDGAASERIRQIALSAFEGPPMRALIELVMRAVARIGEQRINEIVCYSWSYFKTPEWETELAHLLEIDLPPKFIFDLVRYVVTGGNMNKVDARRRKRLLPLFQAAAASVREDPSATSRLEEAEKALELPGSLLSTRPVKAPKAPPRVALKYGAATEGGPVLALPVEAVPEWGGILLPSGKPPEGADFKGTDYGRACDTPTGRSPWGSYGFISVGKLRAFVLGSSCSVGKPKDGSCLLVMQGEGEEVAALLKEGRPWKRLEGIFSLPSGQFVLFDSAHERAKTRKTTVKLEPGEYTVDEYEQDDEQRHLWIVRLTRA